MKFAKQNLAQEVKRKKSDYVTLGHLARITGVNKKSNQFNIFFCHVIWLKKMKGISRYEPKKIVHSDLSI